MAIDKGEKKGKRASSTAPLSEVLQKKIKKQKAQKEPSEPTTNVSQPAVPSTESAARRAVANVNQSAVKSKKDPKRAADFLNDNEEGLAVQEKSSGTFLRAKGGAKRSKLTDDASTKRSAALPTATENTETIVDTDSHDMAKAPKARKKAVLLEHAPKKAKTTLRSQGMTQAIEKIQTNGDSFTVEEVNGSLEQSSEEDFKTTTTNGQLNTPLHAEAQLEEDQEMADEVAIEDEDDDQAAALLAGFDSNVEDSGEDKGLDPADMGDLDLAKKQRKKLRQAARKGSKDGPGAVYVGRIPRGFYETQMRQYFSQFGNISNLRLSRNKTTGASKHFAFIEFESNEVAKIVAQTMDNYLMFGHILKCKYAPSESLHPDTWKGANKRFKKIPYNKIEKRKLEEPKTKEQWESKIAREQAKREKKLARAQALGYDYDLPQIQGVDAALERKKLAQGEGTKAIEPVAEAQKAAGSIEPVSSMSTGDVALNEPVTKLAVPEVATKERSAPSDPLKKAKKGKKGTTDTQEKPATKAIEHGLDRPELHATILPAAAQPQQKKAKKMKKSSAALEHGVLPTNGEAQAQTSGEAVQATDKKRTKKEAKRNDAKGSAQLNASSSTAQHKAERPKFAYHPDEIAELIKPESKKQKTS